MPRLRKSVTVSMPPRLLQKFRRIAKSVYPKEAYGILIGEDSPSSYAIHQIYIPEDMLEYSTSEHVLVPFQWWEDAQSSHPGLRVVGDIHSHTMCADASPSEVDHLRFDHYYLQVIMAVWVDKRSNGKSYIRTRTRYWIPGPHITVVGGEGKV